MRMHVFALVLMGGLLPAGLAYGQIGTGAAGLRCSALAEIAEDRRVSAINYLAGYNDGERAAMSFGTVGTSTGAVAAPATGETGDAEAVVEGGSGEAAPAIAAQGGPSPAILPQIDVEAILAACAQSPDSRIIDIITAQGAANSG